MTQSIKMFFLDGKDYFDEHEGAHYCCVGSTKFREIIKKYAIPPINFEGKLVYRKADLQRVIEGQAHGNTVQAQRRHGHNLAP